MQLLLLDYFIYLVVVSLFYFAYEIISMGNANNKRKKPRDDFKTFEPVLNPQNKEPNEEPVFEHKDSSLSVASSSDLPVSSESARPSLTESNLTDTPGEEEVKSTKSLDRHELRPPAMAYRRALVLHQRQPRVMPQRTTYALRNRRPPTPRVKEMPLKDVLQPRQKSIGSVETEEVIRESPAEPLEENVTPRQNSAVDDEGTVINSPPPTSSTASNTLEKEIQNPVATPKPVNKESSFSVCSESARTSLTDNNLTDTPGEEEVKRTQSLDRHESRTPAMASRRAPVMHQRQPHVERGRRTYVPRNARPPTPPVKEMPLKDVLKPRSKSITSVETEEMIGESPAEQLEESETPSQNIAADDEETMINSPPRRPSTASNSLEKEIQIPAATPTPVNKGDTSFPKSLKDDVITSNIISNLKEKEFNSGPTPEVKEDTNQLRNLNNDRIATDSKSNLQKTESNRVSTPKIEVGNTKSSKELKDDCKTSESTSTPQNNKSNKESSSKEKASDSNIKRKESNIQSDSDVKAGTILAKKENKQSVSNLNRQNIKSESDSLPHMERGKISFPESLKDDRKTSSIKSNLKEKESNKGPDSEVKGNDNHRKYLEDKFTASNLKPNLQKKESKVVITSEGSASRPKSSEDIPIAPDSKSHLQKKESNRVPFLEVEGNASSPKSLEDFPVAPDTESHLQNKESNRVPFPEVKGNFNDLNKNIEDNFKPSNIKPKFMDEEMEINLPVPEGKDNRNGVGSLMCKLLKKQLYTDVNFFSKGRKAILSAHRAVLAAKCKFFQDVLFNREMMNEAVGLVMDLEIKNVPFCIFANIVKYFYTDYIEFSDDYTVLELYAAAQYFEIPQLIDKCEIYIDSIQLTEYNVCSNLQTCNAKNILPFKTRCIDYIQKNTFQVVSSTDFEKCSFSTIREICQLPCLNLKSEAELLEAILRWLNNQPKHTIEELTRALLKCVRFLSFTPKEFSDIVQKHADILMPEESLKILMYLNNPTPECLKALPKWCNKNFRTFKDDAEKIEKELLQHHENKRIKISLKPPSEKINISKLTSILHMRCRKGVHQVKSLKLSFEDSDNIGSVLAYVQVKVCIVPDGPTFTKILSVQSRETTLTFTKDITVFEGQVLQMEVTAKTKQSCIFLSFDKWYNDPNWDFDCFFISEPMTHKLFFISGVEYGPCLNAYR